MRTARANDHWRHVLDSSRERRLRTCALRYESVVGLGAGEIPLHHALTVICGANGVGKSTLLSICRLTLNYTSTDNRTQNRFRGLRTDLQVAIPPSNSVYSFTLDGTQPASSIPCTVEVHSLDAGAEWFKIRKLIELESNFSDLLSAHGSRDLDTKELRCLRRLSGKPYQYCKLYEIDEFDDGVFPYCVVCVEGTEYGLDEMGAGEGALFISWWKLSQIRGPSILLLEEPETHITPQSQVALMDLVAEKCDKNSCCIVTTHSPDIISKLHRDCIRLIVRNGNEVKVVPSPSDDLLEMVLGVTVNKNLVLLVEDRCAEHITRELIRHFRPELSSQVHVAIGGSSSLIVNVIRDLPTELPAPKIVGVLDGDMLGEYGAATMPLGYVAPGHKHPVEFLPWPQAPDAFLRAACGNDAKQLADALQVPEIKMFTILSSILGVDHHDWLEEVVKRAEVSYEKAIHGLLQIALKQPDIKSTCQQFVDRIAHHLLFE